MTAGERTTEVEIFGERYTLRGTDSPEYLARVAEYVDGKFHEVVKESPTLPPAKIAVLASLNIADDLFKRDESVRRAEGEVLARIEEIFQLLHRGGVVG
ncbi:MAG: cell division protein ZapA [candidate division NC10 bacterium]|nr:cell division protein ZapA [candidate division NC10 bacterium]MBI2454541.1 cell division protein ZapA [candidate division NC10 bacterium]MBI2561632.1 cell division protein ZapA [candidate division NC10 bacterium]MBI3085496.1 cell division protein ZapA [candidate division NC10 bacterium]MBI3120864.1 cell division protein ZapA [candidate division NC10 bacterium]